MKTYYIPFIGAVTPTADVKDITERLNSKISDLEFINYCQYNKILELTSQNKITKYSIILNTILVVGILVLTYAIWDGY